MPKELKKRNYYFDLRFEGDMPARILPELSMTALQALSCGVIVFDSNHTMHTELPSGFTKENSTKEFIRVLEE